MIFSFGGLKHERLEIDVRYERPPRGDYHDDNWVRTAIIFPQAVFEPRQRRGLTDEK